MSRSDRGGACEWCVTTFSQAEAIHGITDLALAKHSLVARSRGATVGYQ
jgi:hypothetical protein